jgi:hypothetical protein
MAGLGMMHGHTPFNSLVLETVRPSRALGTEVSAMAVQFLEELKREYSELLA